MKLTDDLSLPREAARYGLVFFLAERKRHWNDIANLDHYITDIMARYNFTAEDFAQAQEESERYVEF
jgi:hypothetical protein